MLQSGLRSNRVPRRIATCLLILLAAGCGDEIGTRYPVAGKVMVNGKPLRGKTGTVLFKPDPSKGNAGSAEAGGLVDSEGNYTLSSKGKEGVPPGWFKVVVSATELGADRPVRIRSPINPRYCTEKTTPLTVEVVPVPAPGAYDLKLTN